MKNKPQNNPQKKVTKIVLVDAFTFSNLMCAQFLLTDKAIYESPDSLREDDF